MPAPRRRRAAPGQPRLEFGPGRGICVYSGAPAPMRPFPAGHGWTSRAIEAVRVFTITERRRLLLRRTKVVITAAGPPAASSTRLIGEADSSA